jgi:hypothetical protein
MADPIFIGIAALTIGSAKKYYAILYTGNKADIL